jgi:hypothetical protein
MTCFVTCTDMAGTLCTTQADCAHLAFVDGNVSQPNWCVVSAQCDATYGACVIWPRCRADPYFGCLAMNETCVSDRAELHPPLLSGSNLTASPAVALSAPSFVLPFVLGCLLTLMVMLVFILGVAKRDCRGRQSPVRDAAPPLLPVVSIDAPAVHERLTRQYDAHTNVF